MAEQLALRGLINQAEALLEQRLDARRFDPQGWDERDAPLYAPGPDDEAETLDFDVLREVLARDDDSAFLFDGRFDGIDQSADALHLGMASLRVDDWFTAFDAVSGLVAPSPFAQDVTREAGGMAGEGYR